MVVTQPIGFSWVNMVKKNTILTFLIFFLAFSISPAFAGTIDSDTIFITNDVWYSFNEDYDLTGLLSVNAQELNIEGKYVFNTTTEEGTCNITLLQLTPSKIRWEISCPSTTDWVYYKIGNFTYDKSLLIDEELITTLTPIDNFVYYNYTGSFSSHTFELNNDTSSPSLTFQSPTEPNGTTVPRNWTEVNITIDESNLDTFDFDWDYTEPDDYLVGYWRFDNNSEYGEDNTHFYDYSGTGNNGTCSGSYCPTYVKGKKQLGLKFDGSNDYVSVSDDESLDITDKITIELWVYPEYTGDYQTLIHKGSSSNILGNEEFSYNVRRSPTNYIGFSLNIVGSGWNSVGGTQIPDKRWSYIVCTYNGSVMKVYKNGVLVGSKDASGSIVSSDYNLKIGDTGNAGDPFNGTIDEVRIYNKSLSAEEVKQRYLSTRTRYYDDSLVLALNFNNNSAIGENSTYAVDISKQGNDGTIHGATWTTGKFGKALNFDGVDDYVDCGNDSSIDITDPITIEAWVNVSSGIDGHIVSKRNGSSVQYVFYTLSGYLKLYGTSGNLVYNANIDDDQWHHVVGIINGADSRMYFDGNLVQTGTITSSNIPDAKLYIGTCYTFEPACLYKGKIDEVRIYNRALTGDEIKMHYLSEFQKYNSTQWRFYNNLTDLEEGTYTYYGWANDTVGNSGQSEVREVTVDTIFPSISYNPSTTSQGYYLQDWIFINITASDDNKDSVILEWNGTNETFDNSNGNIYWENKTGLSPGKYTIKAYINDTAGNSNSTSERIIDLYNISYGLPVLMTDSIVNVNENQLYNFSVNITSSGNITNFQIDLTDYYNETLYSNNSAYNKTVNITQQHTILWVNLTGNTVVQKSPADISCPVDYSKGDYSGYGYCKKVTGTEDIREVYYIMWIDVKDNSSRNYEINFSMPFIIEDLSDLESLSYSINGSNKNLSFSTSSKYLEIGTNHSTSSLSKGEYQVEVNFSYLYEGPHPGGAGGSTSICGNGICERGETPENCKIDCANVSFELSADYLVLTGYPDSEVKCWNLERGCAVRVKNPLDDEIHIHIEVESNDESGNWTAISTDEITWSKILDFDILGKCEKWVYFNIKIPESAETEKEYQVNLKFIGSGYTLEFPIIVRVEKRSLLSSDYLITLLNGEVFYLPRSGISVKWWHVLFVLFLLIIMFYFNSRNSNKYLKKR